MNVLELRDTLNKFIDDGHSELPVFMDESGGSDSVDSVVLINHTLKGQAPKVFAVQLGN
jgi:hypothetical protein